MDSIVQGLRGIEAAEVGEPVSSAEVARFADELEAMGLPRPEMELLGLWALADWIVCDDVVLFSMRVHSTDNPHLKGCVPDLVSANVHARSYYAAHKRWQSDWLVFGENQTQLFVYGAQDGLYYRLSKEDLEAVEMDVSVEGLLERLFEERLGLEHQRQREVQSSLESEAHRGRLRKEAIQKETSGEKLERAVLEEAREQLIRKEKVPISFEKVEIQSMKGPHLSGQITVSEPRRCWQLKLTGTVVGDEIHWEIEGGHRFVNRVLVNRLLTGSDQIK